MCVHMCSYECVFEGVCILKESGYSSVTGWRLLMGREFRREHASQRKLVAERAGEEKAGSLVSQGQ